MQFLHLDDLIFISNNLKTNLSVKSTSCYLLRKCFQEIGIFVEQQFVSLATVPHHSMLVYYITWFIGVKCVDPKLYNINLILVCQMNHCGFLIPNGNLRIKTNSTSLYVYVNDKQMIVNSALPAHITSSKYCPSTQIHISRKFWNHIKDW